MHLRSAKGEDLKDLRPVGVWTAHYLPGFLEGIFSETRRLYLYEGQTLLHVSLPIELFPVMFTVRVRVTGDLSE